MEGEEVSENKEREKRENTEREQREKRERKREGEEERERRERQRMEGEEESENREREERERREGEKRERGREKVEQSDCVCAGKTHVQIIAQNISIIALSTHSNTLKHKHAHTQTHPQLGHRGSLSRCMQAPGCWTIRAESHEQ